MEGGGLRYFSPTDFPAMHLEVMHVKLLCQQCQPPSRVHSIYRCHAVCEWPECKRCLFCPCVEEGRGEYEEDEEPGAGREMLGGVKVEEPRKGAGGGRGGEKSYNSRGQNFDPIDVLQEPAQLKPKPSYMSDFVNYSERRLLTPR